MTPQEQQLIDGLIQRVNGTNLSDKDPEAEQRLQQGFSSNPNALYILSQTILVQQFALDQAKKQLDGLKTQLAQAQQGSAQPPQKHTGFLESIFGSHTDDDRPTPPPQPAPGYAPVATTPLPYTPNPAYAPPPQNFPPAGGSSVGGGGGFLRGAAQTAAGVAAGALAFQGVESLLHGFGNSMVGGGGSGLGGFGAGGEAPREEIVNNYYGNDGRPDGDTGSDADTGRDDSRGFDNDNNPGDNAFTDSSRDDTGSNFADTSDQDNNAFDNNNDDSGNFGDDSNSFGDDSGGGFDDGGGDLNNDNSF